MRPAWGCSLGPHYLNTLREILTRERMRHLLELKCIGGIIVTLILSISTTATGSTPADLPLMRRKHFLYNNILQMT